MKKYDINPVLLTKVILGLFIFLSINIAAADDKTDASDQYRDIFDALTSGKIDFSMRYRSEHVDDNTASRTADASTLRTTLGYSTHPFYGVGGRLQIQDVRTVGLDSFNDATGRSNARTQYAVVADPSDTEILEGYLSFNGLEGMTVKLGRQLITYRKAPFHRFMGTVLWRQNWQNHDALSIQNKTLPDTTISYAYSWNVNRIFTERAMGARSNFDSNSHFLNLQYKGFPYGNIEAYAYLLDFDNAAALSTNTYGARFYGTHALTDRVKLLYTGEYAHQDDAANNPSLINADYLQGEIGANFKPAGLVDSVTIKFDYELLEGKGAGNRFITPLATGHAYQGWADRFLLTPGDGIEDFVYTIVISVKGANLVLAYHNLNADNLGYDYGHEIDVQLTRTFMKHYTLGLKYANFDADTNATNITRNGIGSGVANDVSRFWAFAQLKF